MPTTTTVFTDGACSGNPGPGGWAWAVPDGGPWASGFDPSSTNQRMELQAVLEAVRSTVLAGDTLHVVTDSTYVRNCFRDGWYRKWHANGWRNSKKEPVANRDLWEPLIDAFLSGRFGVPDWVKGHSGDAMNDFVDALAVRAIQERAGATGPA